MPIWQYIGIVGGILYSETESLYEIADIAINADTQVVEPIDLRPCWGTDTHGERVMHSGNPEND